MLKCLGSFCECPSLACAVKAAGKQSIKQATWPQAQWRLEAASGKDGPQPRPASVAKTCEMGSAQDRADNPPPHRGKEGQQVGSGFGCLHT